MKASELRIANWINIADKDYQVTQILERGVNCGLVGAMYEIVKPIPLTDEWLKRFGFEKDEDGIWEHHQSMWSCEISGDDDSFNFKKIGLDILCPDVLYVHQLQNLYFALTGEELKTDETNQKVNL